MLKRLKRHDVKDRDLDQVQENVKEFVSQIESCDILSGRRVSGIYVGAPGNVSINHLLGRVPTGWFVTRRSSAATIYEASSTRDVLVFTVSGACTFDVWVF